MALMAHQCEEYVQPGYFPGQFNRGLFESNSPRAVEPADSDGHQHRPLAYPFYLAPVLFPKKTWLGLTPGSGGLSQIVPHGIGYVRAVGQEGPISREDWAKGVIGGVGSAVFGAAIPKFSPA